MKWMSNCNLCVRPYSTAQNETNISRKNAIRYDNKYIENRYDRYSLPHSPSKPTENNIRFGITQSARRYVPIKSMILVMIGILKKKSVHRARRVGTGKWLPFRKVLKMLFMHVSGE